MDKNKLIAYLYNELSEQESKEVAIFLKDNPSAKEELEELKETRKTLSNYQDEEVVIPSLFIPSSTESSTITTNTTRNLWLRVSSIAATLLAILAIGFSLSNSTISYKENELIISFGKTTETIDSQKDINSSNDYAQVVNQLAELQKTLSKLEAQPNTETISKADLVKLKKEINTENVKNITKMTAIVSKQQQEYTDKLLTGFAKYLEDQRQEDLITIDYSLNSIQENTEILAKMIEYNGQ